MLDLEEVVFVVVVILFVVVFLVVNNIGFDTAPFTATLDGENIAMIAVKIHFFWI